MLLMDLKRCGDGLQVAFADKNKIVVTNDLMASSIAIKKNNNVILTHIDGAKNSKAVPIVKTSRTRTATIVISVTHATNKTGYVSHIKSRRLADPLNKLNEQKRLLKIEIAHLSAISEAIKPRIDPTSRAIANNNMHEQLRKAKEDLIKTDADILKLATATPKAPKASKAVGATVAPLTTKPVGATVAPLTTKPVGATVVASTPIVTIGGATYNENILNPAAQDNTYNSNRIKSFISIIIETIRGNINEKFNKLIKDYITYIINNVQKQYKIDSIDIIEIGENDIGIIELLHDLSMSLKNDSQYTITDYIEKLLYYLLPNSNYFEQFNEEITSLKGVLYLHYILSDDEDAEPLQKNYKKILSENPFIKGYHNIINGNSSYYRMVYTLFEEVLKYIYKRLELLEQQALSKEDIESIKNKDLKFDTKQKELHNEYYRTKARNFYKKCNNALIDIKIENSLSYFNEVIDGITQLEIHVSTTLQLLHNAQYINTNIPQPPVNRPLMSSIEASYISIYRLINTVTDYNLNEFYKRIVLMHYLFINNKDYAMSGGGFKRKHKSPSPAPPPQKNKSPSPAQKTQAPQSKNKSPSPAQKTKNSKDAPSTHRSPLRVHKRARLTDSETTESIISSLKTGATPIYERIEKYFNAYPIPFETFETCSFNDKITIINILNNEEGRTDIITKLQKRIGLGKKWFGSARSAKEKTDIYFNNASPSSNTNISIFRYYIKAFPEHVDIHKVVQIRYLSSCVARNIF